MSIDRYGPARDTKRIPGLCMSARCCGQAFFATLLAKKISFFDYADTLTYAYNGNGQQISVSGSGVIKTYAYTPAGMLASYTSGSTTQTNLYNGDGQRVQKKEGSAVTNYFYQNGSVLYTTDSLGNLKAFYLLNVSDAFATSRIETGSEAYYFYTEDQRGSTVNVLDKDGNRVVSYWYSDFGEVSESKASAYSNFENELRYTGAIYDERTGLLYLNARFYDPSTGRFLTQDTYRANAATRTLGICMHTVQIIRSTILIRADISP